jgi:uncharacterized repeat protein (TIGR01451 family)
MKSILTGLLLILCFAAQAQVTAINPTQAYQGQSLSTTITSSGLFLTSSSPQGNIQNILLKNASDSVFAVSDSINVVSTNTATTFWNLPSNLATGLYSLVVRIYNSFFSGPTTDQTLSNAFTVNAATATVSGTVYNDLNHNGVKDAGEPGLPGYTIHLSPLGNIGVSDINGNYTVTTVPGLDTIVVQQPADDIYRTAVPASYILTVPLGATTGKNFGLVLYRYLSSMTPDSASVNQTVTTSILSSNVFKNEAINNIAMRNSNTGALIYGYNISSADTNHAAATFSFYGNPHTGYYDLVVVVQSTQDNNIRTFILDSAFKVYGPVGFISGYVFADSNSNGVRDAGEAGIAGQYIELAGSSSATVLTDSTGYYSFYTLPNGSYNVSVYNPYSFYASCPITGVTYTTATFYSVPINRDTVNNENFGTGVNSSAQYDLFIHPGWTPANPGFVRHYWIFYGNLSNIPATGGVITMQYDSTIIFDSCQRTPTTNDLATHTLTWNVGTIDPTPNFSNWYGGWNTFNLYFTVPVTDTAGTLISTFFSLTPTANDCTLWNNTVSDVSPVTSSRDPNEKHSSPYGNVYSGEDSIITYTINFQNTGTASTHFVIVKDTLDHNLDYKTAIATGGSGPFKFDNNNGILTFTFDPLVLTDSASDVNHSVGFASFMVKVKSGTPIGTTIRNTAYVFFDYNSAVITNTAINEVSTPLGIRNMKGAMNVSVHPNPFEESTILSFSNPTRDKFILTLYDLTGNVVRTMTGSDVQFLIEKEGLSSGIYMYKLTNQNTKLSAKGKVSVL